MCMNHLVWKMFLQFKRAFCQKYVSFACVSGLPMLLELTIESIKCSYIYEAIDYYCQ